jgi:hypothetical protein
MGVWSNGQEYLVSPYVVGSVTPDSTAPFFVGNARVVNDDFPIWLGTSQDIALVERSAFLDSQTALSGVLVKGSTAASYHMPKISPDSLILSNVTWGGGMLLAFTPNVAAAQRNSTPIIWANGLNVDVRFGNYPQNANGTDDGKLNSVWTFGGLDSTLEVATWLTGNMVQRSAGLTEHAFFYGNFTEMAAPYGGNIAGVHALLRIDSSSSQNLTGAVYGLLGEVAVEAAGSPTYARADGIRAFVRGGLFGPPNVTSLAGVHILAPTRSGGTWGTYTSLEIEAHGSPGTTNNWAIWSKGGVWKNDDATASSSYTTGAVVVAGGIGIAGAIYTNAAIHFNSNLYSSSDLYIYTVDGDKIVMRGALANAAYGNGANYPVGLIQGNASYGPGWEFVHSNGTICGDIGAEHGAGGVLTGSSAYDVYLRAVGGTLRLAIGAATILGLTSTTITLAKNVVASGLAAAGAGTGLVIDGSNNIIPLLSLPMYKDNLRPIENTERIWNLEPRQWEWNKLSSTPGVEDVGFNALEVAQVYPELVTRDAAGETRSVKYSQIVAPMLAEMKKLRRRIEELEAKAA